MFTYNNNSFVYLEICLRLNRKIWLMIYRIYPDLQLLGNYIYVKKAYLMFHVPMSRKINDLIKKTRNVIANVPFCTVWKMNDLIQRKRNV